MTAYQDYHPGHLIYKHNMGHEKGTGVLKMLLKIGLPKITLYWCL